MEASDQPAAARCRDSGGCYRVRSVARDEAVRHRGAGTRDSGASRGPAGMLARRGQSAPHQAARRRGDSGDQLYRPRSQLGHLQPRDHGPLDRAGCGRLSGHVRRGLPRRAAGLCLPSSHRGRRRGQSQLRCRGRGPLRLPDQPHRLRRPAPGRGRQRGAGRGRAYWRLGRAQSLPRADRSHLPVHGHPLAHPRAAAGRPRRLSHGGRRLRDGGPAQLDGRVLQDLRPASGAPLALYDRDG